ncbi:MULTISPECIES: hypothetical protein [Paenibacillus]|uniref:hypothetical protein n=1 Tax=Paenibacillus TaxID=44249 RepID=UPI002FE41458
MNVELIQNASHLLRGELSPETGIELDLPVAAIQPYALLLEQSEMPAVRRQRLLSIYIAIKLALQRHGECEATGGGEALVRKVLDGDYLYSLYVQLCLKWGEIDLLAKLAPVLKQIQIQRAEGQPDDDHLLKSLELYLQLESHRIRRAI